MGWFRSNRRLWGIAALVALSLQIALSFGHVHGIHTDRPTVVAAGVSDYEVGSATQPSGDDHDSHYCAIYAINALLSGAQVATAPVVLASAALASTEIAIPGEALRVASRRVAFHSRAPPLI
jgi:hypothetical protein